MTDDYAEKLLNEVHEKLKKQKEEAKQILEDMRKDKNLFGRSKKFLKGWFK
jgi:F0F1-type ATP synthase membrane subunit b/b'